MIEQKEMVVPFVDYALLKIIRTAIAQEQSITIRSLDNFNIDNHTRDIINQNNAEVLVDYYNMTVQEVLEITGHYVKI